MSSRDTRKIRILIAADNALSREGMRRILSEHEDLAVVGETANGREAVEKARAAKPDVILMAVSIPRMEGIEATRHIIKQNPSSKVLVVSLYEKEDIIFDFLTAGATGCVLRDCTAEELVQGIRSVAAGTPFFAPGVSRMLVNGYLSKNGAPVKRSRFDLLTGREREVLQLIAGGLRNKEAAARLGLSVKTIEVHRTHITKKLEIHNIAGLVKVAIQKGLVKIE